MLVSLSCWQSLFVLIFLIGSFSVSAFTPIPLNSLTKSSSTHLAMSKESNSNDDSNLAASAMPPHPFCQLPGDPSLILITNIDLGDKKLEVMKACSKAIAQCTGKPETYVAVSITDKADVIFGGSDEPTALGTLYSIGAIGKESNGQIT